MTSRKLLFLALASLCAILATVTLLIGKQPNRQTELRPSYRRVLHNCDVSRQRVASPAYGKIAPPASLSLGLVDTTTTANRVTLTASVLSTVPVCSGRLILNVPNIGTEPERTEVLWSAAPSPPVAETVEYTLPPLPVGTYRVIGVFEFIPESEVAAISKSLYLDVRPETILYSNVSFEHIQRVELWKELEYRVLKSLKPSLGSADPEVIARERKRLDAADPGMIARKIAELTRTDADVARRISALKVSRAETATEAGRMEEDSRTTLAQTQSARSPHPPTRTQPSAERAVPVR